MTIPVFSIVGHSNCGKTTLLERLIPELKRRGYRIAVVKHHPHPGVESDVPGKDTWRLARAGADHVTLVAPDQVVHRRRVDQEPPLQQVLDQIDGVDLVITEGFKRESTLKIEVNRQAHNPTLLSHPEERLALVADRRFDLPVPQFDLDDVGGLADLIEARFLRAVDSRLRGNDGPTASTAAAAAAATATRRRR